MKDDESRFYNPFKPRMKGRNADRPLLLAMDIDPPSSKLASSRQKGKGKTRVEKRRVNRSSIVFPKYKERKSMKKK